MEPKRQVFGWDDHERPKRDAGQALQATHLDGLASLDEASALSSSYALPRFVRDHAPPASGPGAWTVEEIVHRYDMRRKRFMIRQWLRAAKKQRRERQLEMEKVMREAELFEAKEATRVAEARAEDLNRRAESPSAGARRAREVSDEERERIAVERAEDRARGDRAEEALLVMVGAAATIVRRARERAAASSAPHARGGRRDEGARRGSVLQQQAEAKRLAELSASGFDVAEEQSPETIAKLALPRALDLPKTAAEELAAADAGGAPVEEHRPDDLAEEILLAFANHQSLHAGAGGARAAAVESLPTYQEMTNWKTAFVDGRQLARIVFAELEALLPARAVKGVERAEGVNLKGRKTLLGYRGTGPRLWQRGVDQGALQSFASDVRGRLDRPNDLAGCWRRPPRTTAQDAGIGDMVQLTVDAANMMEAVGELEADEWRNSILWDHVRNTVDNKAFSELARRGRIVPGPRFEGNVARDPAEARAPAAAA
ncbi:hypothetical protein JL720_16761 [Aureococcus anophagefferens]|nr:hypothetical protein JL720_16761 [Aureococcus anophagefferens]